MDVVVDQISLRRYNLSAVLRHLCGAGPRSRARIATDLGLNKATVSSLVAELGERGLVLAGDVERGQVGRPGQVVEVDGRVCGLGLQLGVDHVAAYVLDLRGEMVSSHHRRLDIQDLGPAGTLAMLAELIGSIVGGAAQDGRHIAGVGVGVPGLVESAAGSLRIGANLGWRDTRVVDELVTLLGNPEYPIHLDNDANLAAIAERATGCAVGAGNLIYLTGDVGIGGGVIVDGRVLRGADGFAGEVGHMTLAGDGRLCGCGRKGCWETVAGMPALLREIADPGSPIADPAMELQERLAEIRRRAELGDARTLRGLDAIGTGIGLGASVLVNIFNPQVLVLGGFFSVLGDLLMPAIQGQLSGQVVSESLSQCRVERSAFPFTAAARGGAHVVLESVLADPTRVPPGLARAGGSR
ncbi:ROK family transcriptional regulator [Phytoactinopolyspora alkaliphila]|nr:ROK family transcriptional regulator [Phytoactinopolyspora alkaliphila]